MRDFYLIDTRSRAKEGSCIVWIQIILVIIIKNYVLIKGEVTIFLKIQHHYPSFKKPHQNFKNSFAHSPIYSQTCPKSIVCISLFFINKSLIILYARHSRLCRDLRFATHNTKKCCIIEANRDWSNSIQIPPLPTIYSIPLDY